MKPFIKIILIVLAVMIFSALCSCKEKKEEIPPREYVESEVIENATALLEGAKDINRILWGVGILPTESDEGTGGVYLECKAEDMARYGIECVEDIRTLCKTYYSGAVCQTVENTVLGNVRDENESILSLVRYYDKTDKETNVSTLMVHTEAKVYFEKEVTYHTETLKIKEVRGEVIYLTVNVTVYDENDAPYQRVLTFSLLEEESGWRLHSPTYMKYDPYADIYDNLTKN